MITPSDEVLDAFALVKEENPETDDSNVPLATQRRLKKFNLKYDGSMTSEAFCPICNNPLNGSDSSEGCHESGALYAACCPSCRFQILPQDGSSLEHFGSLLPHHMVPQVKKHQNVDSQTYLRQGGQLVPMGGLRFQTEKLNEDVVEGIGALTLLVTLR